MRDDRKVETRTSSSLDSGLRSPLQLSLYSPSSLSSSVQMFARTLVNRLSTHRVPLLPAVGSWLSAAIGLPPVFGRTISALVGRRTDHDQIPMSAGFLDHSNPWHQDMVVMRSVITDAIGGPLNLTVEYTPGRGWEVNTFGEPASDFDPVEFQLHSQTEEFGVKSSLPRAKVRQMVDSTLTTAITQRNRPVKIGSVPKDQKVFVLVGLEEPNGPTDDLIE